MSFLTDPKPVPRIVDRTASKRKLRYDPQCRSCGERAMNCHHLLGKAQRGDDVEDNLIPLCGSGSNGCHGALHGTPYRHRSGFKWDAKKVRTQIGMNLNVVELAYLIGKLGEEPALEHLRTQYHVDIDMNSPWDVAAFDLSVLESDDR